MNIYASTCFIYVKLEVFRKESMNVFSTATEKNKGTVYKTWCSPEGNTSVCCVCSSDESLLTISAVKH